MNEKDEALAYSQLLLLHADTITDSGVKEMVVNSAAELTILHLRVEALRRENERLREQIRDCDGTIEALQAAVARAAKKVLTEK